MRFSSTRLLAIAVLAITVSAVFVASAAARNVYFTNYDNGQILRTDVNGGTPQVIVASAGANPNGIAVDRAAGRIYWAVRSNDQIRSSLLDGSDVQTLNIGGASIAYPVGVAIDARTQRIYWANSDTSTIGWASLDGSGTGGSLDTGTATISSPQGVALDTFTGRLYWANTNAGVSAAGWTSLDGSGASGDLGGPTASVPIGLAYSSDLNQIFWSGYAGSGEIVSIDATTGTSTGLSTAPIGVGSSGGIGLDAATGRLYISGYDTNQIYAVNADGTGGGAVIAGSTAPWGSPAFDGAGALSPASVTINSPAGVTGTGTLRLTNSGDYPIDLYGRTFSSSQFAAGAGCPDRLPVGGVCDLTVSYTGTGSDVAATLTIATDAGNFVFNVTGSSASPVAEPQISKVKAATRCAKSDKAGSLSVSFLSATAVNVTARLQRSSRLARWVPKRCPRLFGGSGNGTKLSGKIRRKSFAATAGSQAFTLKQLFKVNQLTPGRYRLALSYTNASGQTVTKSTWFWVLR